MSEMVDRVTRAICTRGAFDPKGCCGECGVLIQQARAAIAALRKPTDAMLLVYHDPQEADMYWQAMLDEALK